MGLGDALALVESDNRRAVMADTWGHLAPIKNKKYAVRIVYAVGCFGNDPLNPTPLLFNSELDSSPWFYDAMQDFLYQQKSVEGGVYEFVGSFRNYQFKGTLRTLAMYE